MRIQIRSGLLLGTVGPDAVHNGVAAGWWHCGKMAEFLFVVGLVL